MISIRVKIMLSIICMSFVAIALTGFFARTIMVQRFEPVVVQEAAVGFHYEVIEYYKAYGSWKAASAAEPFVVFAHRNLCWMLNMSRPKLRSAKS